MPLFDWIRSDLHSLNLDWIISKIKTVEESEQGAVDAAADANASKTAAAASATAANNSKTAAAGSATLAAVSAQQAQNLVDQLDTTIAQDVSDWLENNLTPTSPPVDDTLTFQGAAADAKKTGDEISDLKTEISKFSDLVGFETSNAITSIASGYYANNGVFNSNTNFSHSNVIDVENVYAVYIDGNVTQYTLAQFQAVGIFLNDNDEVVSSIYNLVYPNLAPWLIKVPTGATKLYINSDYRKSDYLNSVPSGMVCFKVHKEIAFYSDISAGKHIKFIAGVIRNSGNGWEYINDTGHEPLNLSGISVDANGRIKIDYSFTASKVLSLVATPDETFARLYTIGGSVGLDNTLFNVYTIPNVYGGLVTISNNVVNINNTSFTNGSVDTTTGEIRLYHPTLSALLAKDKFNISASANNYHVVLGSQGNDYISLYLKDDNGTIIKSFTSATLYVTRSVNSVFVDANNIVNAGGNFWIYGIMEV